MKIIQYINSANVTVEFQDEYKYKTATTYNNFNRRCISNPYSKSVYGIGYVGIGKYPTHIDKKNTDAYGTWKNMLLRCYHEKERDKHPAYADCTVCKEWHNYQVFAEWYETNYYDVGDGRMHIDKDILIKGNKEYAPDKCIFVPQKINMVFMKKSRNVDSDLPNGIYRCVTGYSSSYNGKSLGVYETLEQAIEMHDIAKRIHIKELAEEYKTRIPLNIYNSLLEW